MSARAGCACGALTVRVTGRPQHVSICHCHACRSRTGSAFSWNARFDAGQVTSLGTARSFARAGDDGGTITYHFCGTCGVSVWYTNSGRPDAVMIPVGAFAPGDLPAPTTTVYDNRRPGWLSLSPMDVLE